MILCILYSTCHVALAALHLRGEPLYIGVHLVSSVFFILSSLIGGAIRFTKDVARPKVTRQDKIQERTIRGAWL